MASRRTTTTRETKVTSRRATTPEDAGAGAPEAKKGMTMVDAIVIITAIIMVAAILVTDYHLGHNLGKGVFLKP
jgi:hypothetical protein